MPWIDVLDGGMLTTVQDTGRAGSQRYGVPVSGAMDGFALRAANRLVGNAAGAAGLEMTLTGPELRFESTAIVAITGADLAPQIDGEPVANWRTLRVRAGSVLSFAGVRDGLRAYLAVAGGIDVPIVLGSRSTYTRSGLGGFDGRALRTGDRVPVGENQSGLSPKMFAMPAHEVPRYGHACTVRVILGPQDDAFSDDGRGTFLDASYTLTTQSDRIGCRFQGPPIRHHAGADIVSDGTVFGAIQVSGDGMPIVLMADRGTTGGYTKIATVITADLTKIAQAIPGDRVRFTAVDLEAAHTLFDQQESWLDAIDPGEAGHVEEAVFEEDSGAPLAAGGYQSLADALADRHGDGSRDRDARSKP
ncbi:MAG: biotin-dependent carboxyltransferase family protein [Acidobacteriota bacterium]